MIFLRKAAGCSALRRKMRDKDNVDKGHHPLRFFFNTIYRTATSRASQSTAWLQVNAHAEKELQLQLRRTASKLISPTPRELHWLLAHQLNAVRRCYCKQRTWAKAALGLPLHGVITGKPAPEHQRPQARKQRTDLQFCLQNVKETNTVGVLSKTKNLCYVSFYREQRSSTNVVFWEEGKRSVARCWSDHLCLQSYQAHGP